MAATASCCRDSTYPVRPSTAARAFCSSAAHVSSARRRRAADASALSPTSRAHAWSAAAVDGSVLPRWASARSAAGKTRRSARARARCSVSDKKPSIAPPSGRRPLQRPNGANGSATAFRAWYWLPCSA